MPALPAPGRRTRNRHSRRRQLGENDPGAISGLTVTNTTADIVGTKHLKQVGSPAFTNALAVPQRSYRLCWP